MAIHRIIWDFNGTLLDDLAICLDCVNELLERHGHKPFESLDAYRRTFRFPIEEYYRLAGFDFSVTPYSELAAEYMEMYYEREPQAPLAEGIVDVIDELNRLGIKQSVLSASRKAYLDTQLEKRGIFDRFDTVLGISDIYAASKVGVAREWIASSGEDPRTMLLVGDTLHDAETAMELGCRCVLYSGGHQSLDGFDGTVIDSLKFVPEIAKNY